MSARKLNGVWLARSAMLVTAIGMASSIALAQPQLEPAGAAMREKAFWLCDYVATTRGVQFTPMEHCARVTDELKDHKFGGDYDRMVQWWRGRKLAEHQKLRVQEKR